MCYYQLFLCLVSLQLTYVQDSTSQDYRHELNGVGIHGGIGWSLYGKGTTSDFTLGAFLPHGGIHGRWFTAKNIAILHALDYFSFGVKSKSTYSRTENRLRTLQLSNSIEAFFKAKPTKPVLSVRGGFFVGRIIEPIFYWHELDTGLQGQNTPINTFGKWNAGFTVGAEVSKKLKKSFVLSTSLQYDLGIRNVYASTLPEGSNAFTRAYRLGLSITFPTT